MDVATTVALSGSGFAIVASVFSGLYTYFQNKKRDFIDVVTSERMKWMGALREDVAEFIGLAYKQVEEDILETETNQQVSTWQKLRTSATKVRLRLNPLEEKSPYDKRMIEVLDRIILPQSERFTRTNIDDIIIGFISDAQAYLKIEWERVKLEAEEGHLNVKSWAKKRASLIKEFDSTRPRTLQTPKNTKEVKQ